MRVYDIDIVGTCNLACPSCPVGNMPNNDLALPRPKGFMKIDLFREIIAKIVREANGESRFITLFNWGEPLLHPEVDKFVNIVNEHGLSCMISTNFNVIRDLRPIVRAKPHSFRVSLSGWSADVYEKTHRNGDINLVKSNLHLLRHLMDKMRIEFSVELHFHLYKHNLKDALLCRAACQELRFAFHPIAAGLMPIEKSMKALDGGDGLADDDLQILHNLLISPKEITSLNKLFPVADCDLRSRKFAINYDGSVPLCCGVYDPTYTVADSFVELGIEELQRRRYSHSFCDTCFNYGIPSGTSQSYKEAVERLTNHRCNEAMKAL